ncbi:MAG: PstS family phosphate ABC transporter substrate-binding protein [Desulfobacterales bacterium]|nr:PstS family phosphate ABC transporter substrate-binding protein [Desulfobacterales bacterium]
MKKNSYFITAILLTIFFMTNIAMAGNLVIKGSTTVLPIAQQVAEAYMIDHPDVKISISGGGSGNGMKAVIDGTTDIGNASRFIKSKEIELALERGAYPVPFRIAYDCIIPVVHPSNTIDNITLENLKAIYEGKIKNWNELGGPDRKIVVISRDTSSGTYEVWEDKVMNKERVYPGALLQASNGAVVQAISKNQNAVGYVGIAYLNESLKALKVNGVEGSEATTLNGTYPISRPLFMFTRNWPIGDTLNFINFILNPQKGQKLVKSSGFVPLY